MTDPLGFEHAVAVHAVALRVIGFRADDEVRFKLPQAQDFPFPLPSLDGVRPRQQVLQITADDWPGAPIPLDWELPKGERFQLEPTLNGRAVIRWRRFELDPPIDGVVIGSTYRQEGTYDDQTLVGPKRSVNVYQVALRPGPRSARAVVAFVHGRDLSRRVLQPRGVAAPPRGGLGLSGAGTRRGLGGVHR